MVLGRGDRSQLAQHRAKFKATPSAYQGEGPASIEDAYTELTHHGFSVWMRLMVATDAELSAGRVKLARLLKYSETRSNAVFRELRRKGYIMWITTPGFPSQCVLLRRAKIRARTNFVRISNIISTESCKTLDFPVESMEESYGFDHYLGVVRNTYPQNPPFPCAEKLHITLREIRPLAFLRTYARILTHIRSHSYAHTLALLTHKKPTRHTTLEIGPCDLITLRSALCQEPNLQKPVRKRKFVDENGYITKFDAVDKSVSYKEKISQRVLIEKVKRERVRSSAKQNEVHVRRLTKIDFGKLDQRGDPTVSFDPDSPLRDAMLEVLNRPTRDAERKRLMSKLGTEFARIYVRYRRQAESVLGMPRSVYNSTNFAIPEREKQYAAEAGMWCVMKGVTPRHLLEYWHSHIRTFADRRMVIPPLSLMRAPGMVDQAACSAAPLNPPPPPEEISTKRRDPRPSSRNSFSDEGAIDRRLRRGLERAGFDTQDYSDRYLMTVQQLAIGIANGQDVFVSSKMRSMVSWVAENLYKDG